MKSLSNEILDLSFSGNRLLGQVRLWLPERQWRVLSRNLWNKRECDQVSNQIRSQLKEYLDEEFR